LLKAYNEKFQQSIIKERTEEFGVVSLPHFAKSIYGVYLLNAKGEKEFIDDFSSVLVGVDNLHNIRGWLLHLIKRLKETKDWTKQNTRVTCFEIRIDKKELQRSKNEDRSS